jgi:hypothetical protein
VASIKCRSVLQQDFSVLQQQTHWSCGDPGEIVIQAASCNSNSPRQGIGKWLCFLVKCLSTVFVPVGAVLHHAVQDD